MMQFNLNNTPNVAIKMPWAPQTQAAIIGAFESIHDNLCAIPLVHQAETLSTLCHFMLHEVF